jgi:TRAP-type C4-dicarboxylate transport system permease small subunit
MIHCIDLINKKIEKVESIFITYLLILMSTVIFIQIIMRYVFNNSLSWSEELAAFMMMWMTWVGASYGVKQNVHLRVTIFVDMLKGRARDLAYIIIDVAWMVFSIYMVVMGLRVVKMSYAGYRVSPALQVPMYLIYSSVVVGCVLMCLSLITSLHIRYTEYKAMAEGK